MIKPSFPHFTKAAISFIMRSRNQTGQFETILPGKSESKLWNLKRL